MNVTNIVRTLLRWRETVKPQNILIVTHKHADPDAAASAVALAYIVDALYRPLELHIVSPEDCSNITNVILEKLGLNKERKYSLKCGTCPLETIFELVFIVDTANKSQLGECGKSFFSNSDMIKCVIIDHHSTSDMSDEEKCISWRDATFSSTSEMILAILGHLEAEGVKVVLPKEIVILLVAGILYDTKRLQRIAPFTLKLLGQLPNITEYYRVATSIMRTQQSFPERMAILKGLQRMIVKDVDGVLVAGTHVGSYESQVARNMILAGADIALVLSVKKDSYRIAVRTRRNIDAGKLASTLANILGGSGGGHAESALVEVLEKPNMRKEKLVSKIMQITASYLERVKGNG